jgi:hypothetical protein
MITLLRREFTVELPLEKAWQQLARVEQRPSWAKHIKQIDVQPPGELGRKSNSRLHLNNGVKAGWPGSCATFTATEFNPYHNWKWVALFLSLKCHYDHLFEELNPTRTKLTWVIEAKGFRRSVIGRLFAKVYSKSLDRAIPLLVDEMNASRV